MPINKLRDLGRSELQKRLNSMEISDQEEQTVTNGIDKVRSIEPQRAYLWEVSFPDPFTSNGEMASLYAQQTAIPASINENIKRYYAGIEYSYPSRDMSPRIFRITFFDNDQLTNYKFFDAWRRATSYTREQLKTSPVVHNRDIELKLLDVSDQTNAASFIMYNCRPTEISETSLSYESSGILMFDVLFYFTHKDII